MKLSRAQVRTPVHAIPSLQFEDKQLTSFSGAVLIQALFQRLDLRARLASAFGHNSAAYGLASVFSVVVTQLMLGLSCLRDRDAYQDDPLVLRVLRLKRLPDVATVSRTLSGALDTMVGRVRQLIRSLVLERLARSGLTRVTLDFDGSVQSTKRHAEGSAVGFNRTHKGQRSYYPLFCTLSQLGMFFDFHHRPGNVHDSNGAEQFVRECVGYVRGAFALMVVEARLDSAFFQEQLLDTLHHLGVEFSASVPFERFAELKGLVQATTQWAKIDDVWSSCEIRWRPKSWAASSSYRIILYRRRSLVQRKGPLQLDLFVPRDTQFEYKVVVSNKKVHPAALLVFHNGRGVQEALFGEAKNGAGLDYVPARTLVANQLFAAAGMLAHNLGRELVWQSSSGQARTTRNRAPSVPLRSLNSLQKHFFRRAGRLTRPQGTLVLTIAANDEVGKEIEGMLAAQLIAA